MGTELIHTVKQSHTEVEQHVSGQGVGGGRWGGGGGELPPPCSHPKTVLLNCLVNTLLIGVVTSLVILHCSNRKDNNNNINVH